MTFSRKAGLFGLLLISTSLSTAAQSTADQSSPDEVDARLDRLERLVGEILTRLDRLTPADKEEIATLEETARAVQANAEALKAQSQQNRETVEAIVDERLASRPEPDGFKMGNTRFTFGGYLKADTSVSVYSDGALPSGSNGRDLFIPNTVPVSANPQNSGAQFDFNPRETRFLFKSSTPVGDDVLTGHLEFDFLITNDGNEIISNSFAPRLRQGFIQYKGFTFGQVWSTFQDMSAYPDNLELIGASALSVFNRQPMIRYQTGPWEFALEQPEVLVTGLNNAQNGVANADILPDAIARYTFKTDRAQLRVAGILRQLRVDGGTFAGLDETDSAVGYGINLSGKIFVGNGDDIRFTAAAGEGLGRYVGLGAATGVAVTDNRVDAIASYSGYVSYRHLWNDYWRSVLTLGYFKADNPVDFTGNGVTDEVQSMAVNLQYSPVPKLTLGIEYIYARRQVESGLAGTLNRALFSAKMSF